MCSLLWPHANRRCSEKCGSGIGGRRPFQHKNLDTQPKKLILSEQKKRKSRMPYNVDFQSSEQGVLSEQTCLAHTSANFYSCSDIGKKKKPNMILWWEKFRVWLTDSSQPTCFTNVTRVMPRWKWDIGLRSESVLRIWKLCAATKTGFQSLFLKKTYLDFVLYLSPTLWLFVTVVGLS